MPPTREELLAAVRVLEALAEDRTCLSALEKEERQALLLAAGRVSRPERHEQIALRRALAKRERRELRERDRALLDASGLRASRRVPLLVPHRESAPAPAAEPPAGELGRERLCYVCKARFRTLHHFYDSMCEPCGDFNFAKRRQTADLRGQVALVTGARVKIGYQASLLLLRAGATVIATTRFPKDAALRYAREPDFEAFRERLHVYGLDLRHFPSVERLCLHLDERFDRLDHLLNNACQTVRRPPGWYRHLLPIESADVTALPEHARPLVAGHEALRAELAGRQLPPADPVTEVLAAGASAAEGLGILAPDRLSQLPLPDELELPAAVFPEGKLDLDLQQVDLRDKNSWRLTLAEVPTAELLEVHLVNAVAPFLLNARLKPLMLRARTGAQHIVNVSAMEGQFNRVKKTEKHPHTNMAKAALNMMTRTSAPDYVRDGIHMNSVDTGWITDEDPAIHAERKVKDHLFSPPLDALDGAARIVDPIFSGVNTGVHVWGQFLKDYRPTEW